jgi:hypothetical protein
MKKGASCGAPFFVMPASNASSTEHRDRERAHLSREAKGTPGAKAKSAFALLGEIEYFSAATAEF